MIIGVISDTHRINKEIYKAIQVLNKLKVDVIIHLGDNVQDVEEIKKLTNTTIINVQGNCDYEIDVPSEKIEVLGEKKFFITHGHNYSVKMHLNRLKYRAMEVGADIVLYGHTHVADINHEEGIWFINPGSVSASRLGPNSFSIIKINDGKVEPSIVNL